jgi:hypothetical protein
MQCQKGFTLQLAYRKGNLINRLFEVAKIIIKTETQQQAYKIQLWDLII